jgi:hypothetical protein
MDNTPRPSRMPPEKHLKTTKNKTQETPESQKKD